MERVKVKNRMFYRIPIEFITPVSVSSGESELTDHDIIRTAEGKPFIPGSSVAGALREFIHRNYPKYENQIFGKIGMNEKDNAMSRIIFSDIVLDTNVRVSARDGIALEEGSKTTKDTGKFDYQIAETHARGTMMIECVIYSGDELTADNVRGIISIAAGGMKSGEIRFGFRKNRGLGKVNIKEIYSREFDFTADTKAVAEDYIKFCEDIYDDINYINNPDGISLSDAPGSDTAVISVPLTLQGGISIRTYSAVPNDPDFAHLTIGDNNHKKAVIPGSSWNGAIRARTFDILKNELGIDSEKKKYMEKELLEFWGVIDERKKEFCSSKIIFSESELEGSKPVRMTRNKINRFDASTSNGALYTELSYFGGNADLEIMIRDYKDYLWCIWLVKLSLDDLLNGLLSVGGQTAVGRGIFNGSEEKIKYTNIDIDEARKSLVSLIKGD